MSNKIWRGTGTPGEPGILKVRQYSTGYVRDDTDATFKAVPGSDYVVPVEDGVFPGLYSYTFPEPWGDDAYQFYWYTDLAMIEAPHIVGITLVDDAEPSQTPADIATAVLAAAVEGSLTIAEAVRLLLSANVFKASGGGTANVAFRDLADSKDRIAATVNPATGDRLSVTIDGA